MGFFLGMIKNLKFRNHDLLFAPHGFMLCRFWSDFLCIIPQNVLVFRIIVLRCMQYQWQRTKNAASIPHGKNHFILPTHLMHTLFAPACNVTRNGSRVSPCGRLAHLGVDICGWCLLLTTYPALRVISALPALAQLVGKVFLIPHKRIMSRIIMDFDM
jgi:hypothetical protein